MVGNMEENKESKPEIENSKFAKGSDTDVSNGPMGADKRGCTDLVCLLLFLCAWGAYAFVTFLGLQEGNPQKLYKPRDFRGQYCGIEENWNGGLNLQAQEKLTYMMNVTESVDHIAKQLLCSSVAENALRNIWGPSGSAPNSTKMSNYECGCCKAPCKSCDGSLDITDNIGNIGGKMGELTDAASGKIFSPNGMNDGFFGNIWQEANKYFVPVCSPSCDSLALDAQRTYTYSPFPDAPLSDAWKTLDKSSGPITNSMKAHFTFKALPTAVCPYDARYCIPFPGVEFKELPGDFCMFKLSANAVQAVGDLAGKAFEGLGADKIAENMMETWGSWSGDFVDTIPAFILVSLSAFVIGLIFLVLLRFFVGCVVWFSILLVFLLFFAGGALCYVRHSQCAGVGLFASGHQKVASVAMVAERETASAISGNSNPSEAMTGNGEDYRGAQTRTRTFRKCQPWASNSPTTHTFKNSSWPNADLTNNYCRNPGGIAATIWCYTTEGKGKWELCSPIGTINAQCTRGYEVESKDMRKALEILAFVLWGIAALWFLFVMCMCRRILLAIAVNKVAAIFVYNTPTILFVPMCQVLVGILWCLGWAMSAAFLLSQVPKDHVPTTYYATYAEAYGTENVPGKCTGAFINGHVFKYAGNPKLADDPCSGKFGDTSGLTPRCWACYPPRYVIDWRFAVSFFVFLWNNAFLIAMGQLIIAVACCTWFFAAPDAKKTTRSVRTGLKYCFRYHLGSLAFGSFIIAVVQFIRYALMYFEKQATAAKNRVAACVMRIVQVVLWCLEKCIKFLNKNAYIQIALLGKSFCPSAKAAFYLILRNCARFAWVALLGGIINFIGLAFIVVATAVVGYFILKAMYPEVTPVLPMTVYVFTAYLVAKLYMNVFHLAVGSVLQCFLATEEMDGPKGHVPPQMQSLVQDMGERDSSKSDSI